jgi:hypothetical protein
LIIKYKCQVFFFILSDILDVLSVPLSVLYIK